MCKVGSAATAASMGAWMASRAEAQTGPSKGKCAPPQHFRYSYTSYPYNSCANEVVRVTVDLKYTVQICVATDGSTVFRIHTQTHGVGNGIDLFTDTSTGTNYILNGQDRVREVSGPPADAGCFEITSVERYREKLIAKGAPANSTVTISTTFAVDSSCNLSFNSTFEIDCRG
jgi:hypothetical protein